MFRSWCDEVSSLAARGRRRCVVAIWLRCSSYEDGDERNSLPEAVTDVTGASLFHFLVYRLAPIGRVATTATFLFVCRDVLSSADAHL